MKTPLGSEYRTRGFFIRFLRDTKGMVLAVPVPDALAAEAAKVEEATRQLWPTLIPC